MSDPAFEHETSSDAQTRGLVDHFFRHQYGRLVSIAVRRFGTNNLEAVEDGVQAALEQALGSWSRRGIPSNPEAWLTQVAQHRIIDHLRRANRDMALDEVPDTKSSEHPENEPASFVDEIADDELRMLFVCSDDSLSERTRLILCLKLLCGFSTREISARLFLNEANVQKLLERGRARLRETWNGGASGSWSEPGKDRLRRRLNSVQQVIYLQFNEGYSTLREDEPIRPDICFEALRLGDLLVSHSVGDTGSSWALLALMHFHAARLGTRVNALGELLLLEVQDRSRWDPHHIQAGLHCLSRSAQGNEFSYFHGEAAIQAEHCLAPTFAETRWDEIVEIYELLEQMKPSPLYALNRAIALSEWKGHAVALEVLRDSAPPSWLSGHYLWQATVGEMLRRGGDFDGARNHLSQALKDAPTRAERQIFEKRLRQVEQRSVEKSLLDT